MLIFNEQDIHQVLPPKELISSMERAFRTFHKGDFVMPDRMHMDMGENNTLLLMPSASGMHFSTKLVSVFPENVTKGRPAIYGNLFLNDGHSGEPLALMNGSALTALRTGAVGAVAAKFTAPEKSRFLGIVGAGIQGVYQAFMISACFKLEKVFVFDTHEQNLIRFKENLQRLNPEIRLEMVHDVRQLVAASDIIVTATSSYEPVLPDNAELLQGKHFIGIGSFRKDMQEMPAVLFRMISKYFIDTPAARHECGDVVIPVKEKWISGRNIYTLSELISQETFVDKHQTTLVKSVGMALFDLFAAKLAYLNAIKKQIGTQIEL